jgi:hypothetical protein
MLIKTLFDPSKDIYRTIEKVITYNAAQEARLRAEIGEYIVTDSIDDQLERLLIKMQAAMEDGGHNEVGVWVSGFYGSGKSSFTKYLALGFDDSVTVDGVRFLEHLIDRLGKAQTKAQLRAMAGSFRRPSSWWIWRAICWRAHKWKMCPPFSTTKSCNGRASRAT